MSYFDHVRCHACKAVLDPESLATVPGQGLSCPQCKAALSLTDLFGLKDAFQEEEAPDMSLDDLVPARRAPPPKAPPRGAPGTQATSLVRRPQPDEDEGSAALDAMRALKRKR